MDSAKQAAAHLLGESYLTPITGTRNVLARHLPLAATNYWRGTDETGQPIDLSWRIDFPFQILFLLDIGYGRFVSNDASRDCLA